MDITYPWFTQILHSFIVTLPEASHFPSLSDSKIKGIKQKVEISEQSTTQNIEFSPTLQVAEETDVHEPGRYYCCTKVVKCVTLLIKYLVDRRNKSIVVATYMVCLSQAKILNQSGTLNQSNMELSALMFKCNRLYIISTTNHQSWFLYHELWVNFGCKNLFTT